MSVRKDIFTLEFPEPEGFVVAPELYRLSYLVTRSLLDESAGEAFEVFVDAAPVRPGEKPKRNLVVALAHNEISYYPSHYWVFRKIRDMLKDSYGDMAELPHGKHPDDLPAVPEGKSMRYAFLETDSAAGWITVSRKISRPSGKSELNAHAEIYVLVDTRIFTLEYHVHHPIYGDLEKAVSFLEDFSAQLHLLEGGYKGDETESEIEEQILRHIPRRTFTPAPVSIPANFDLP